MLTRFEQAIAVWRRGLSVLLVAAIAVCLTGCVRYDVGIHYAGPHRGEIVQHVTLSKPFSSLSDTVAQTWLDDIQQRTNAVGGRAKRLSSEEMSITIPFFSGAEMVEKFNQFFAPAQPTSDVEPSSPSFPALSSTLALKQNNLLVVLRNRLSLDIDLRSLGVASTQGDVLVTSGKLLDLEFHLTTPWGARVQERGLAPTVLQDGRQLVWTLEPGKLNHLEAIFWAPSPIGIGAVVISMMVGLGMLFKRLLTAAMIDAPTPQAPQS